MDTVKIYAELNEIFRDIFDDNSLTVSQQTTAADIADWTSLVHINLIVAVEEKFNIKFSMGEVIKMQNVGDMVNIISSRI